MHELMKREEVAVFLEPRDGDDEEWFQLTLDSPTMHVHLTLDGEGAVVFKSLKRFAKWLDSAWWERSLG
jgi:hypothetical protein